MRILRDLQSCAEIVSSELRRITPAAAGLSATQSSAPWQAHSPFDPFQQPAQHAARSDFVKLVVALAEQVAHRIFPADRRNDLLDQQFANFVRIVVRLGVDVRRSPGSRRADRARRPARRQPLDGRAHDRRVKRAGHGQRNGLHRAGARPPSRPPARRRRWCRRSRCCPGRAGWRFAASRPRGPARTASSTCGRSSPRMLTMPLGVASAACLHGLAAGLHQPQPVFEFHRAGEDQRRVFAQAQAGRGLARQHDVGRVRLAAIRCAARLVTNRAGWLTTVESSSAAGLRSKAWPGRSPGRRWPDRTVGARRAAFAPARCPCRPSGRPGLERERRSCSTLDPAYSAVSPILQFQRRPDPCSARSWGR